MTAEADTDEDLYFPGQHCESLFSELSLWTSVEDCLAAARYIENRALPGDLVDSRLVIPFVDDETFEAVPSRFLQWLIASYRPPETKIKIAKLIDPAIKNETLQTLLDVRFRPNISAGPAGAIGHVAPGLRHLSHQRVFLIEDQPHVIEFLQNPLRCIIDMMSRAWPTAENSLKIKTEALHTGEAPTIFHQPYTDGPLFALVEAVIFYVHTLHLGTIGSEKKSGLNLSYRSVEVVGRPPIDPRLLDAAQETSERMFQSLA
jgi:hypothetical protein